MLFDLNKFMESRLLWLSMTQGRSIRLAVDSYSPILNENWINSCSSSFRLIRGVISYLLCEVGLIYKGFRRRELLMNRCYPRSPGRLDQWIQTFYGVYLLLRRELLESIGFLYYLFQTFCKLYNFSSMSIPFIGLFLSKFKV